ncbi:hypothetical protein HAX54_011544 [Datura stramonium]|uniref:DYW domain-containing protein n=1 Tax=Datura stramonium TaxID=4076 RepID=A0ABS8TK19_DATST|nr:hypothetical protein [Datura stramonium]
MQLHARGTQVGPEDQTHVLKLSASSSLSLPFLLSDLTYARYILTTLRTPNSYYYNIMIRILILPNLTRSITLFLAILGEEEPGPGSCPDLTIHDIESSRNLRHLANVGTALIDSTISGLASHGLSEEAMEHFEQMKSCSVKPDERTMTAVLSACKCCWIGKGRIIWEGLEEGGAVYQEDDAQLIRMLCYGERCYGGCKIQRDVERSKRLRVSEDTGSSRIEIDGLVHEFTAGDSRHVEAETIYAKLDEIEQNVRREGYDPKVSEVLLEIDDDEKASQLLHHSEKLAVSTSWWWHLVNGLHQDEMIASIPLFLCFGLRIQHKVEIKDIRLDKKGVARWVNLQNNLEPQRSLHCFNRV